jgi:RNA polymerase-binding transcription factor DksA
MTKDFLDARKADLQRIRDDIRSRVQVETQEFNRLFDQLSTKDYPEQAHEEIDEITTGLREVTERERLRSVAAAFYRMEQGTYGICQSCGGEIHPDRLEAIPDAQLCLACKSRLEGENR